VYIGEAHPSDAWQLPSNIRDGVVYASPGDADERANLAEICVTRLSIKLPALVDRFDDSTDNAYSGWPDRVFLIDRAPPCRYIAAAARAQADPVRRCVGSMRTGAHVRVVPGTPS
jgi:hypothetical protein